MPIPKRRKNESKSDFIDRCMADPVMRREYPKAEQRRAVCERQSKIEAAKAPPALEIRAAATIEAAAAADGEEPKRPKLTIEAYNGGLLQLSGFYRPVVIDLATLRAGRVTILRDHMPSQVLGQGSAKVTKTKVRVAATITGDWQDRNDPAYPVVMHAQNGFTWAASVGVGIGRLERVQAGKSIRVNGRTFNGPIDVARDSRLGEVSIVGVGADETAETRIAAAAASAGQGENEMPTFEEWLEAKGLQIDELSDDDRTKLEAEYAAEAKAKGGEAKPAKKAEAKPKPEKIEADGDATPADAEVRKIRAAAAAESERIAAVEKLCGDKHAEIKAKAIGEGWDATKTELEILRADRPKAPAGHVPDDQVSTNVLEAAVMLATRYPEVEKEYDEKSLDAAHKQFQGRLGLQELLLEAARANGYTGRNFRWNSEMMRAAFASHAQAAFSTVDISGILGNVANKHLLKGFFSVERTWRNICAIRNVSDFKTVTSYRLIGGDQYEKVGPNGEIKHGDLDEESYTNKADTFAKMFGITRTHIINDDLGAISTVPRKLGRGSGLAINHEFWTEFLADASTFYTSARGNYFSGATSALGLSSLETAEQKFMDQTDGDGKPLGILPKILLVPTALSATATALFKSVEIRNTTSSTKYPVFNPHSGKFRPEVSAYLGNSSYTGYSTTAFYLLADPEDCPVIEVAFLNGQESPTIETADANFATLGIEMRGYHDFGMSKQDYRGAVKSKGAA